MDVFEYIMTTKDTIIEIEHFVEALDKSDTPEEFMLYCTTSGIARFATKEFFDNNLFPFIFNTVSRKRELMLKLNLKRKLSKLNKFYRSLYENLD